MAVKPGKAVCGARTSQLGIADNDSLVICKLPNADKSAVLIFKTEDRGILKRISFSSISAQATRKWVSCMIAADNEDDEA